MQRRQYNVLLVPSCRAFSFTLYVTTHGDNERGRRESHITYSPDKIRLAYYSAKERKNGHSASEEKKKQAASPSGCK
jgi:hypothetical protein